jgi:CRISPR-associated protein Csd1
LDWQIGKIKDGMPTFYPKNLNLQEQGRFAIGYYHQRFTRHIKTEKGIVENPVAVSDEATEQTAES